MTTCYKLTNNVHKTQNNTSWGENVTHKLPEKKKYTICSGDVFHAYPSPELAALMDVIHGGYLPDGILWECEGEKVVADGTKIGCRVLTTLKQIRVPLYTPNQRIAFGILCAQHVCEYPDWNAWANEWLSGKDRSKKSATYAANCAALAAYTADYAAHETYAAALAAARATYAAYTAYAADYAAHATYAAYAADYAARATYAADYAAHATYADYAAHNPNNDYSFIDNAALAALSTEY